MYGSGSGGGSFDPSEDEVNAAPSFDEEKWVRALLHSVHMDPDVGLGNPSHPNHTLLAKYPNVLKAFNEEIHCRIDPSDDMPEVIPGGGILLEGNYGSDQKDFSTQFNPNLFNATGWTLVLRAFVHEDARSIAVFGRGWRWFQLTPKSITLNNQDLTLKNDMEIKKGAWNDIFISFNLPQENTGEALENTNPKSEILAIINTQRIKIDIDPSTIISIYKEDERTQQSEKTLTHVNYSNAACFKGLISSESLFNRSCNSHDELQAVAEMMYKNHQTPGMTYDQAKGVVVETVDAEVYHPSSESIFDDLISKNKLVVIDFFATWCGPCKAIAPFFKTLANKNPDVAFVKVDVDILDSVSAKYQVNCMPTFVFVKDGKVQNRLEGASRDSLSRYVDELKK